jgi:hypothetical protein
VQQPDREFDQPAADQPQRDGAGDFPRDVGDDDERVLGDLM